MKRTKLSLASIQDTLSREEMKKIMAGSGDGKSCTSCYSHGTSYSCDYAEIRGQGTCTCSAAENDGTGCVLEE